jgi:hypothetical protein
MRKAFVCAALAASIAAPTAAQAADGTELLSRYGTEDCYLEMGPPPSIIVITRPPYIVTEGVWEVSLHCPPLPG